MILDNPDFEKKLFEMTNEAIEVGDLAATAVPLQILSYINGAYTVNANLDLVNKNLTTLDKSLQSLGSQLAGLDSRLQSIDSKLSTVNSRLSSIVTAVQSIDNKIP